MNQIYEQFIRERRLLHNVADTTLRWYRESFCWLTKTTNDVLTEQTLKLFVMQMREAGLSAASCNNRSRAINAFLHWQSDPNGGECGSGCRHLKIAKLKQEKQIPPTFTLDDIRKFWRWKPKTRCQKRLRVLILTLADTGCRITETLKLKWLDVDFDNLLLTIHGKGRKDRKVPFSLALRRELFKLEREKISELVFSNRDGGGLSRLIMLRDVKLLCRKLDIVIPRRTLHSFRHTFSLHYLRNGGSPFHLQKALGHSSLEMTREYSNLLVDDLQSVHERVSLVTAAKS
jgi:integrase/recombinase XerD